MRVTYHETFSPLASPAAQLEGKKGQNEQTLGGRRSLDCAKGKSDGLASSRVRLRIMSAYE
jgi:hypothetical protein